MEDLLDDLGDVELSLPKRIPMAHVQPLLFLAQLFTPPILNDAHPSKRRRSDGGRRANPRSRAQARPSKDRRPRSRQPRAERNNERATATMSAPPTAALSLSGPPTAALSLSGPQTASPSSAATAAYDPIDANVWMCKVKKVDMTCETFGARKQEECHFNAQACIICSHSCGKDCVNKPFERRPLVKTRVFQTERCGTGLLTVQSITKGDFVSEYVGEVINARQMRARCKKLGPTEQNYYIFELNGGGLYIDAREKGNLARFINSSCEPNCEIQVWNDEDTRLQRVGIFAAKDIKAGEELTFDYRFQKFDKTEFDCKCEVCTHRDKRGALSM